jgi:hypothetical protein
MTVDVPGSEYREEPNFNLGSKLFAFGETQYLQK